MNTDTLKMLVSIINTKNRNEGLRGVFFDSKNNAIVATDTKRMIVFNVDHGCDGIVHNSLIGTLSKFGTKSKRLDVDVSTTDCGMIAFKLDTKDGVLELGAKPLQCNYPDYKRVVSTVDELKDEYGDKCKKFTTKGELIHIDIIRNGVPVNPDFLKELIQYCFYDDFTVYYVDDKTPPLIVHRDFVFVVMPMIFQYENKRR